MRFLQSKNHVSRDWPPSKTKFRKRDEKEADRSKGQAQR